MPCTRPNEGTYSGKSGRLDDSERIRRLQVLLEKRRPLVGWDKPVRGTHSEDFNQGESSTFKLGAEGVMQVLLRQLDARRCVHDRARDVGGAVELSNQFADLDRVPVTLAVAPADGGLGVLPEDRG